MQTEPIDLGRFNLVFFEECAEHLAEMERMLVGLSSEAPDLEQLHAIFRAAHSIKGGAGIFGFDNMTIVTHVMESLLDKIRNGEMPLTPAMIDLFLEACDTIAMQLAGHRDGSSVDQEAVESVRLRLEQLSSGKVPQTAEETAPAAPSAVQSTEEHRCFEMIFTPDPDIFKRGVRLENIFGELEGLGQLTVVAVPGEPATLDEDFDPELCTTSWRMTLITGAGEGEIREILEFVADEDQLQIQEHVSSDESTTAAFSAPVDTPEPEATPSSPGRRAYDRNELAPNAFGRRNGEAESTIRVGVSKVDQLINQVGELVITQLMVAQTAAGLDPVLHENLHRSLLQLERTTRDLQQSVMSIRLVPISVVFSRFPRMVRELAAKLGKQADLKTIGDTTELDKGLIEKITDPLTHLVRNCMDHALELPETRVACGKDPAGSITLRAAQIGGRIVIDVIDDGAGLNRARILAKAAERGIPTSENMSDEEVWHLIFSPGFSTADTVTDISGRGVGMDVVLRNVQAMGGKVQIASEQGQGTRVTISLPLTLAILDGLSVAVGSEKFIIPLNSIIESLQPAPECLRSINGHQVIHVRGDYIPIVALHELFHLDTRITRPEEGILVLVDVDGEKAAVLVDALLDEHQVVIKSLETNFRAVPGTAGATILGDGRVALILDVGALLEMRKREASPEYIPHGGNAEHADRPGIS